MSSAGRLIGMLMRSRTQAHVYHLETNSFSKHSALEAYYTGIVPLLDRYAEVYMGKYGKINKYNGLNNGINRNSMSVLGYFTGMLKTINEMNLPQDPSLRNIQDEIIALIQSTIYKLRNLK
jgi:hypothetical protein